MESRIIMKPGAAPVLILALLMPAHTHAQIGEKAHPFPDTRGQTMVFSDQLPSAASLTTAQWRFIASHYAGTQKETLSWTKKIRTLNPQFIVLHYQLAVGAGKAPFLDGDQWINDFETVSKHSDWFIQNKQGKRITQNTFHWAVMNILFQNSKPISGWPKYWVDTAEKRMRNNQDDGVFADSYTQDILMNQVTPPYPWFSIVAYCKQKWIPNLDLYGQYCADALHRQPEIFYYLPNLGGLVNSWDTTNYSVGDGGMNEGFAVPGPGSYYSRDDWRLQLNRLLSLINKKKIIICQSYIHDNNLEERMFVIGAYLLIRGRHTFINMFESSTLSWYPEYTLPLGPYLHGPASNINHYWDAAWQVYRRKYLNGMILVNPSKKSVNVNLGRYYKLIIISGGGPVPDSGAPTGSYTTTPVKSVIVPGHSSRALLY